MFNLKEIYKYYHNIRKVKKNPKGKNIVSFQEQAEFYSHFINKGDLVFDIGANLGYKTAVFLEIGAKVISVEPQKPCYWVLKKRFNNNDVKVITQALSSKEGKAEMYLDKSTTLSTLSKDWIEVVKKSGRFSEHQWANKVNIQTTTLDNLIKKFGMPKFCKIDVEGYELEVLKGLTQVINIISFEFVPERILAALKCIDYLSSIAPGEFNYHLGEARSFALPNWVNAEKIKTTICQISREIQNYGDIYVKY